MFIKDPDAVLDYGFDWSDWLDGDTISTSSWTIAPATLTKKSDSLTTTTTTIWLSGGTVDVVYTVTNRIVTAGGRTEDRSFEIVVGQR
jgi:hypothetical protein